MTQESIDVLLVEDEQKHIEDATTYFGQSPGARVNLTVSRTLVEAENRLEEREFDGIVSDVFFPEGERTDEATREPWERLIERNYDVTSPIAGLLIRRIPFVSRLCYAVLRQSIESPYTSPSRRGYALDWVYRRREPPTGLLLAEYAIANNIPLVLCTDTHGHSDATQFISDYRDHMEERRNEHVSVIGTEVYDTSGRIDYNAKALTKEWGKAHKWLVFSVAMKQCGVSLTEYDDSRKEQPKVRERFEQLAGVPFGSLFD
ncbi:MAG: hypothetical protein OXR66_04230 [Candidatus Woesearchaeota archaeon]|nr:hypothetical protein [Candidatus Woesearchaeota archaeon]